MQDRKDNKPPYRCPVCGYPGLEEADPNCGSCLQFLGYYEICPSCGTEFGSDVEASNPEELQKSIEQCRIKWISEGHNWFSKITKLPADWDWKRELRAIGVCPGLSGFEECMQSDDKEQK